MRIFLISDSHFDQGSILTFKTNAGTPVRTFDNVAQMNEAMVDYWNQTVKPSDHVYHLGDFAMKRIGLRWARRLNGHLRLVRGNHDVFKTKDYLDAGFEELHGCRIIANLVMTHMAIHPLHMKERWYGNTHGHIHNNLSDTPFTAELGPKYFNVSAEVLGYKPITVDEIVAEFLRRAGA